MEMIQFANPIFIVGIIGMLLIILGIVINDLAVSLTGIIMSATIMIFMAIDIVGGEK